MGQSCKTLGLHARQSADPRLNLSKKVSPKSPAGGHDNFGRYCTPICRASIHRDSHSHAVFFSTTQCCQKFGLAAGHTAAREAGPSPCQARYRKEDIEAEVIDYQGIGSEPVNCCGMRLGETQRHGACHIYPVGGMRLIV